ncbi:MAG: flavin reductase, partial [Comamonadaceae bacterium]
MSDRTLTFVDSESFASIMRRLPGGVSVVTTRDQGGAPCGLTSTAISSVSADPPLLLVCVALTSRTLPALRESRGFVVHFMDQTSVAACVTFASKADDKFAGLEWEETPSGLPRLSRSAGNVRDVRATHTRSNGG